MDDPVLAFSDRARQYCALIEDKDAPNSWIFAQECLRSVLRLCELALLLPGTEPVTEEILRDYYWQTISDDLSDIWRHVKVGLLAMEKNSDDRGADVVCHWRFSFEIHWAQHAAGAIGGLTALFYGEFADSNRP